VAVPDVRKVIRPNWHIVLQKLDPAGYSLVDVTKVKEVLILLLVELHLNGKFAVAGPLI
jgi:hypothetical protein